MRSLLGNTFSALKLKTKPVQKQEFDLYKYLEVLDDWHFLTFSDRFNEISKNLEKFRQNLDQLPTVAEWSRRTYPAPLEAGGVGLIPANSDAQNVPSFRRWRFAMKLSPLGQLDRI